MKRNFRLRILIGHCCNKNNNILTVYTVQRWCMPHLHLMVLATINENYGRILKANLSWIWKKSNSSDVKIFRLCIYLAFFFALKSQLQVLKFEFWYIILVKKSQINFQLIGKISLKLDSTQVCYENTAVSVCENGFSMF